jgi:hypothetical protein
MWLLPLTLVLAAGPMKVVAPTFSAAGVADDKVRYFTSHFASGLRDRGISVITADEIGTLLGVERQRQLLGCADGASECLAELSNALGADATARGTVAFIGGEYAVNVTVLSNAGKVLAQYDTRGRDERGVLDALEEAAAKIAETLNTSGQKPSRFHARSVVPFVLGTLVAIAGGAMLGQAVSWHDQLNGTGTFGPGQGQLAAMQGPGLYALGWVALGVGLAAMVLGIVLFARDGGGP